LQKPTLYQIWRFDEILSEVWLASIKLKRAFVRSQIARIPTETASSPFSPSDLEMLIQILRAIFVAIKCYVFGLMAQKYFILCTGRASSSWYKDKFGACEGGGGGRGLHEWERREEKSEWVYGSCEHFHDSSDSRRRSEKKRGARDGAHFYEVLRESEPWIRFANRKRNHFATYRCLVVVSYVVAAPPLPGSCARNPKIRVRSFSLLVSHAYLEIIEGNEIKFLYSLYI